MRQHQAISASTKYPNTRESDLQPKVWHIVSVKMGSEMVSIEHYASDPCNAIREVNMMPTEQVMALINKE